MTNCDCSNNGIKAYFKLDYKPNKLSQLANDTHYVDINDVLDEINTHNTSETAHTYIQGRIDATNTTIGDLTELDTSVKTSVVDAINSEVSARGNADTALENDYNAKIGTLSDLDSSVKTSIVGAINSVISDEATIVGDLDDLDTSVKTSIVTAINSEVSDRQSADSGLQTQIDALAASSDVTDIVGTYAELQAYDTQHLNDNDIIKVLDDSTHNDAPSYYRYNKSTDSFTYIGSESASYTKAESDTLFVPQTRTVNSKALSADITLTSSDVGALASTTTINDLTTTAQQNALNSGATTTNIGQIATNTSSISTINGKIPSDASSSNKLVTASALSNAVVNLADKDLANLTQTGEERLHALKSYSDNGELLTDAEGLADVVNYAHSTFDISKFTIAGNPSITNDGIASGFSSSDYIANANNITINADDDIYILSPVIEFSALNSTQQSIFSMYDTNSDSNALQFRINAQNQLLLFWKDNDGTDIIRYTTSSTVSTDVKYQMLATRKAGVYNLYYRELGGAWIDAGTNSSASFSGVYAIKFGVALHNNQLPLTVGSVDLKYFEFVLNNGVIANGNITGIDTIKDNDYTEVGSPVISTDGVLSKTAGANNSTSDYITFPFDPTATNWKIVGEFTITSFAISRLVGDNAGSAIQVYLGSSGINLNVYNNGVSTNVISPVAFPSGGRTGTFDIYIEYNNGTYGIGWKRKTDTTWKTGTGTNAVVPDNSIVSILKEVDAGGSFSSDLNSIRYYKNGNLVYQPCLKIPYTLSITGSKVVNSVYRHRVNNMAEQFGHANYYTLSDTDFTLPQVELYGLLGDKRLVKSYYNGLTYWELYSNRRLEQGGTCESGVEYTFTRPFVDANYVLTIPYSSKTAATFIPSATGDFIAKGQGTL